MKGEVKVKKWSGGRVRGSACGALIVPLLPHLGQTTIKEVPKRPSAMLLLGETPTKSVHVVVVDAVSDVVESRLGTEESQESDGEMGAPIGETARCREGNLFGMG